MLVSRNYWSIAVFLCWCFISSTHCRWKIIVHGGIDESSHSILLLSAKDKATTVVYGFLCVVSQYGVPSQASTVEMLRVLSPKKQTNERTLEHVTVAHFLPFNVAVFLNHDSLTNFNKLVFAPKLNKTWTTTTMDFGKHWQTMPSCWYGHYIKKSWYGLFGKAMTNYLFEWKNCSIKVTLFVELKGHVFQLTARIKTKGTLPGWIW